MYNIKSAASCTWVKYTYKGNAVSLFIIDTRTAVESHIFNSLISKLIGRLILNSPLTPSPHKFPNHNPRSWESSMEALIYRFTF